MGLLKIIFIISLLFFPFGEIIRLQFNNGAAIVLNDIGIGLLNAIWLIVLFKKRKIANSYLIKPFLIFTLICLLSLIINLRFLNISEFIVSFLYLLRWVFYINILFIASGFDKLFRNKIKLLMVFLGISVVFGGYIQFFFYPDLRNLYYLGWDEHLYRMFSSFLDPNFAGVFFVLYFIFLLGLIFEKWGKIKPVKMSLLMFFLILTFGGVFLTYSRSAYIMLLVACLTFLILVKKCLPAMPCKAWQAGKLMIGVISFFAIITLLLFATSRSEGTNLLRSASTEARAYSAAKALIIIKENPFLGVGFNAYRYAQYRYGFLKKDSKINNHSGSGTDNSFLFVLATTGIAGFISFIYIWYKIIKNEFEHYNIFSIVIITSIFSIFAGSLFINSLFYPFIMQWLWILIGLRENK
ncbi:MAG: O-antigen ligase family protein [Candidatus Levybacteria bacterium]|nr:O-antigen ligase family protein [Candidatus Levybacteria bacterium]